MEENTAVKTETSILPTPEKESKRFSDKKLKSKFILPLIVSGLLILLVVLFIFVLNKSKNQNSYTQSSLTPTPAEEVSTPDNSLLLFEKGWNDTITFTLTDKQGKKLDSLDLPGGYTSVDDHKAGAFLMTIQATDSSHWLIKRTNNKISYAKINISSSSISSHRQVKLENNPTKVIYSSCDSTINRCSLSELDTSNNQSRNLLEMTNVETPAENRQRSDVYDPGINLIEVNNDNKIVIYFRKISYQGITYPNNLLVISPVNGQVDRNIDLSNIYSVTPYASFSPAPDFKSALTMTVVGGGRYLISGFDFNTLKYSDLTSINSRLRISGGFDWSADSKKIIYEVTYNNDGKIFGTKSFFQILDIASKTTTDLLKNSSLNPYTSAYEGGWVDDSHYVYSVEISSWPTFKNYKININTNSGEDFPSDFGRFIGKI